MITAGFLYSLTAHTQTPPPTLTGSNPSAVIGYTHVSAALTTNHTVANKRDVSKYK